ncbi:MAG: Hpt domain-containing protein [Xanthobacteraceae bacterium]|nr:MAG: Hpt domain-containing protein [Xanthobacteraceae bacterium]
MTAKKSSSKAEQPQVATFADHQVITPPNRLGAYVRRAAQGDRDDPVARAEHALQKLSVQFDDWMNVECDRLAAAHETVLRAGFTPEHSGALYRAAHDIKGAGGTYGYPAAAIAAESLCRIIDHAPVLQDVPTDLIANHIQAILAIVREHDRINAVNVAETLSRRLRGIADEYLAHINRDRPEHLEAILAPSLAPAG